MQYSEAKSHFRLAPVCCMGHSCLGFFKFQISCCLVGAAAAYHSLLHILHTLSRRSNIVGIGSCWLWPLSAVASVGCGDCDLSLRFVDTITVMQVYIIEANPRASRTVPFVAKAIGHPIAKYASLLMSGKTLAELEFTEEPKLNHVAVKEAVLPFDKFPGILLTTHHICLSNIWYSSAAYSEICTSLSAAFDGSSIAEHKPIKRDELVVCI